jgi:ATP-dependent DNA helicase PIF1
MYPEKDAESMPIYAPESETWKNFTPDPVILRTMFRQKDPNFRAVLNDVRVGTRSERVETFVASRTLANGQDPPPLPDGVEYTYLFTRREDVKRRNEEHYALLEEDEHVYTRTVKFASVLEKNKRELATATKLVEEYISDAFIEEETRLKVGTRVILTRKIDELRHLVNGSGGTIIRFATDSDVGDDASGEGRDENETVEEPVKKKSKKAKELFPVVRFDNGEEELVKVISYPVETFKGVVVATVWAMPLIYGWAMTIHRCQGMTLDYVVVDFYKTFASGHDLCGFVSSADGQSHLHSEPGSCTKLGGEQGEAVS